MCATCSCSTGVGTTTESTRTRTCATTCRRRRKRSTGRRRPSSRDLEERGLLEDTLVVWGGEFGRTPMRENRGGSYGSYIGRDHHPYGFTMWMAGGGVKQGLSYGATDDIGYYAVEDKVAPHDLQATMLHLLGFDPFALAYPFQGLNQRLIGPTEEPRVIREWVA
ncbi:MAG: DUF1501 domain-containing protein [Bryobacterales bacterium]